MQWLNKMSQNCDHDGTLYFRSWCSENITTFSGIAWWKKQRLHKWILKNGWHNQSISCASILEHMRPQNTCGSCAPGSKEAQTSLHGALGNPVVNQVHDQSQHWYPLDLRHNTKPFSSYGNDMQDMSILIIQYLQQNKDETRKSKNIGVHSLGKILGIW